METNNKTSIVRRVRRLCRVLKAIAIVSSFLSDLEPNMKPKSRIIFSALRANLTILSEKVKSELDFLSYLKINDK